MRTRLKVLIGALLVVVLVLPPLGFVLPVLKMNSGVAEVKGKPYSLVQRELGPPAREWAAGEFSPARGWPSDRTWTRGRVMLIMKWDRGWYIFFDENDLAVDTQKTKS